MSRGQVDIIKQKIKELPDSPGVYIMKGSRGEVIYVGKAKSLSHRVRSYFQRGSLDIKTMKLVSRVRDIDFIVTENEVEALALECNLIKEHRPRYNIRLKDDKKYPYIKLTLKEKFPRLLLVRRIEDDGSEYFGPFTDVKSLRKMLKSIRMIFPLRDCPGTRPGRERGRECLNFFIKRCPAPCTGRIGEEEYREIVGEVRLFLQGRNQKLLRKLEERMWALSNERKYEEAAFVRDQLGAFRKVLERQVVASPRSEDFDVVGMSREGKLACCVVMIVREGKILGSESFVVPVARDYTDNEVFESFVKLYYHSVTNIAPAVYMQHAVESMDLLERWLGGRRGMRVKVVVPRRGQKKRLVEMAEKNAHYRLSLELGKEAVDIAALKELMKVLRLPSLPVRIEAFDISNIHGEFAVGSMVVFQNARPEKSSYRQFKIKSVEGVDDYAMIEEVLTRRLEHIKAGKDRSPDLVVVDGGKGQLHAALKAMERLEISNIPAIGIAKREELIYTPGSKEHIRLPRNSPALKLIQRLRNEAHRFAIRFHRRSRDKELKKSLLDEIPGIGEARKLSLLKKLGSVRKVQEASIDEIASVPGIGRTLAEKIYEYLRK